MKWIILISKGLIRDQNMRRHAMFYIVLTAVVMLFVGSTFLNSYLIARPMTFLGFWAVCGWLTILALLLAVYDLLVVRAQARRAARQLREEILRRERNEADSP